MQAECTCVRRVNVLQVAGIISGIRKAIKARLHRLIDGIADGNSGREKKRKKHFVDRYLIFHSFYRLIKIAQFLQF